MPSTVAGLLIVFVAILPGALYIWAFEREVGQWGVGLSDRVFRFIGVSSLFLALLSYPAHYIWRNYLHAPHDHGYVNRVLDGGDLPSWLYLVPLGYVVVPIAVGSFAALTVRKEWKIARMLVGSNPVPRAWDALFSSNPSGVVRILLRDGAGWIGGLFGSGSYAGVYPHDPQDLYLERAYQVLDSGEFAVDERGDFITFEAGVLVKWQDVLHLEFFDVASKAPTKGET